MVTNRSWDDFCSICITASRSSVGQSGRSWSLGRGAACTWAYIMPRLDSALKGSVPVIISYPTIPSEYWSAAGPTSSPEQASGER